MRISKRELFLLERLEEVRGVVEELERLTITLRREAFRCHCKECENILSIAERLKFLLRSRDEKANA